MTRANAGGRDWRGLLVLLAGQFMTVVDGSIVNVAIPSIGRDLQASGALLQLVVAGYTICYGVFMILGARLGALFGRRKMFFIGLVAFTIASGLCGLAPGPLFLVVFRFIQGTAAAMMVPQIVSIIGVKFSGSLRVRALSANAGVVAGGFLAGQILGGVLVTANLLGAGWRSIFIVNVPIGIVLAILVLLRVPADVASDPQKLDIGGVVLACASVGSVIVPLVLGREFGWPVWSWVSIAAGVLVGGVFVAVERRIAETSRQPLLNFGVVGVPGFALGLLMLVAVMMALGGFGFSLTLQLQNIWGFSPLETGLVFVASGVCSAAASLYWRHLPSRWYRYLPAVGVVMLAISYVGVSVIFIGPPGGYIVLQCVLAFGGAGLGAVFGAGTTHALTNVPPTLASDASGLLSTVMQLGQAVGVAAIGGVFFTLRSQSDPGIAHAAGAVSVGLSAAVAALGAIAAVVRLVSAHEHR